MTLPQYCFCRGATFGLFLFVLLSQFLHHTCCVRKQQWRWSPGLAGQPNWTRCLQFCPFVGHQVVYGEHGGWTSCYSSGQTRIKGTRTHLWTHYFLKSRWSKCADVLQVNPKPNGDPTAMQMKSYACQRRTPLKHHNSFLSVSYLLSVSNNVSEEFDEQFDTVSCRRLLKSWLRTPNWW